jgi:hypothetical protein
MLEIELRSLTWQVRLYHWAVSPTFPFVLNSKKSWRNSQLLTKPSPVIVHPNVSVNKNVSVIKINIQLTTRLQPRHLWMRTQKFALVSYIPFVFETALVSKVCWPQTQYSSASPVRGIRRVHCHAWLPIFLTLFFGGRKWYWGLNSASCLLGSGLPFS